MNKPDSKLEEEIKELIIVEFSSSEHGIVEEEGMVAVVHTDYQAMAESLAKQLLSLFHTYSKQRVEEVIDEILIQFKDVEDECEKEGYDYPNYRGIVEGVKEDLWNCPTYGKDCPEMICSHGKK